LLKAKAANDKYLSKEAVFSSMIYIRDRRNASLQRGER